VTRAQILENNGHYKSEGVRRVVGGEKRAHWPEVGGSKNKRKGVETGRGTKGSRREPPGGKGGGITRIKPKTKRRHTRLEAAGRRMKKHELLKLGEETTVYLSRDQLDEGIFHFPLGEKTLQKKNKKNRRRKGQPRSRGMRQVCRNKKQKEAKLKERGRRHPGAQLRRRAKNAWSGKRRT